MMAQSVRRWNPERAQRSPSHERHASQADPRTSRALSSYVGALTPQRRASDGECREEDPDFSSSNPLISWLRHIEALNALVARLYPTLGTPQSHAGSPPVSP